MTPLIEIDRGPAANLATILARIAAVRKMAVAPALETTLVAISKSHNADRIVPVLEAGHRVFGENRVQEAKAKWPELRARFADIELHLVGPLQSNKVREALDLFNVIHSLDRAKLADALAHEIAHGAAAPKLFIQVNTGEEPQKAGIVPAATADFVRYCRDERKLPVIGLMCVPPVAENPSPHFALLAKLAREAGLTYLSMGMSDDFETAICFGATHIRVGTAIFGTRLAAA